MIRKCNCKINGLALLQDIKLNVITQISGLYRVMPDDT
jgi:hypothetical protein